MRPGYKNIKITYVNNVGVTINSTFEGLVEELLQDWQSYFDIDFDYSTREGVFHSLNQLSNIHQILIFKDALDKSPFPISELVLFAHNRGYEIEGYEIK